MTNWLSGWLYRKSHVISAAVGAGTNYQVGIKVYYGAGVDGTETVGGATFGKIYCNSKCKTDFGDIRFTNNDGSTLLDFWIQEQTDSVSALIWVEVGDDLSSIDRTIYIYYGKATATTLSNIYATFIKADKFDSFTKYSSNPVMTYVGSGWEDSVLGECSVLFENGTFKMWYRANSGVNSAIGYATSDDGIIWTKYGLNPILTVVNGVAYPFVLKVGLTYYLYAVKLSTNNLYRWSSPDGITWTIDNSGNAVLSRGAGGTWDDAAICNVSIYYDTNEDHDWKMLYEGLYGSGTFKLGYAYSDDGLSWTKYGSNPVFPTSGKAGNPSEIFKIDSTYYCWTGRGRVSYWKIVLIKSTDWQTWTEVPTQELVESQAWEGIEGQVHMTDPSIVLTSSGETHQVYMFYTAIQTKFGMAYLDISLSDYIAAITQSNLPNWISNGLECGKTDNELHIVDITSNTGCFCFDAGQAPPFRILMRIKQRTANNWVGPHWRTNIVSDGSTYLGEQQVTGLALCKLAGSQTNIAHAMLLNTFYVFEVTDDNNNVKYYFNFDNLTTKTSTTGNSNQGIGIQSTVGTLTTVDWIAIAKFIATEPAHNTWGTEEPAPVVHSLTVTELVGLTETETVIRGNISQITRRLNKKIRQLDKFLGWLIQSSNPTVKGDTKSGFSETKNVSANLKIDLQETIRVKAKIAEMFAETMPVTASILQEFTESTPIRGNIIKNFTETVSMFADLMMAVWVDGGLKIKGKVIPLMDKLRELKRKLEEI